MDISPQGPLLPIPIGLFPELDLAGLVPSASQLNSMAPPAALRRAAEGGAPPPRSRPPSRSENRKDETILAPGRSRFRLPSRGVGTARVSVQRGAAEAWGYPKELFTYIVFFIARLNYN